MKAMLITLRFFGMDAIYWTFLSYCFLSESMMTSNKPTSLIIKKRGDRLIVVSSNI